MSPVSAGDFFLFFARPQAAGGDMKQVRGNSPHLLPSIEKETGGRRAACYPPAKYAADGRRAVVHDQDLDGRQAVVHDQGIDGRQAVVHDQGIDGRQAGQIVYDRGFSGVWTGELYMIFLYTVWRRCGICPNCLFRT